MRNKDERKNLPRILLKYVKLMLKLDETLSEFFEAQKQDEKNRDLLKLRFLRMWRAEWVEYGYWFYSIKLSQR